MTVNVESLKKVYFLGIGGIGMSALARYLNSAKVQVHGYDRTPTTLTSQLEKEGISIHFSDLPELLTDDFDIVVYTPAIPESLAEYRKAVEMNIPMMKRSELLGLLTKSNKTLAVAGTHGKTTVSSMLAHILYSSSQGCTAFLGGISKNYDSNLLINHSSHYMVTEADEFDRSFLRLYPWLAIITSADADHLDIYQNHETLLQAFAEFTSHISADGYLLIKQGIKLPFTTSINHIYTYSITEEADFAIENLLLINGKYSFTLLTPEGAIEGFNPILPGLFNVENCIAAAAAAWLSGTKPLDIIKGINTFMGVKRRFDHRVIKPDFLYIDDYAHHPEELKACITSVRKLYPGKKITGIFQPHLYTRTRDFAEGFASSLSLLDQLILLDIYPAREKPIAGVTSQMLLDMTPIDNKMLLSKEQAIAYIKNHKPDILLTLGAGDIDKLVTEIEKLFI